MPNEQKKSLYRVELDDDGDFFLVSLSSKEEHWLDRKQLSSALKKVLKTARHENETILASIDNEGLHSAELLLPNGYIYWPKSSPAPMFHPTTNEDGLNKNPKGSEALQDFEKISVLDPLPPLNEDIASGPLASTGISEDSFSGDGIRGGNGSSMKIRDLFTETEKLEAYRSSAGKIEVVFGRDGRVYTTEAYTSADRSGSTTPMPPSPRNTLSRRGGAACAQTVSLSDSSLKLPSRQDWGR